MTFASSRRRTTAVVRAFALTAAVLVGACGGAEPATERLPAVDLMALDATSPALATAQLRGPAVVNLWATWCGPCRTELPAFEAAARRLEGSVLIIGVNQGDDADPAATYLDEIGVTFPQYLDPDGDLTTELRITGLPATVFVRADGSYTVHAGALDEAELLTEIDTRLDVSG